MCDDTENGAFCCHHEYQDTSSRESVNAFTISRCVRANSSSMRCFSTSKDLEEQSKNSLSSVEPNIEEEPGIQVKENAEATQEFQAKLSGFVQSYEKFSHIDDKKTRNATNIRFLNLHLQICRFG